jgi:ketosteroid isomerase-like protein
MSEHEHLAIVRPLIERWNAGDIDGVVELYTEDTVMYPGEEWPDQTAFRGHEGVRENIEQWRSVWESSTIELERVESYGDRAVASGAWINRGRASGIGGRMPFVIVIEVRGGKIACLEWFTDHDTAVAHARDA